MKYIDAEKLKDEIKHLKIDVYDEAHQFDLGARSSLTFLESFIDSLQQEQPSLPSNIDEAAEEYSENILANNEDLQDAIEDAFKEGARWMAEQGVSVDGKVVMDFSEPYDIINRRLIAKLGDALLKVEPGEVIVQIRKKQ